MNCATVNSLRKSKLRNVYDEEEITTIVLDQDQDSVEGKRKMFLNR